MKPPKKTGVLLLNLGTPDSPSVPDVRRYLAEFLMDPYVVDIPAPLRWLLVHGWILRKRPAQSARQYAQIWDTNRGSPLRYHTEDLCEKVQSELGPDFQVLPAMRYGQPSIAAAIGQFKARAIEQLWVFPLYPQYSSAATESSKAAVAQLLKQQGLTWPVRWLAPFFRDTRYLDAVSEVSRPHLPKLDEETEHVLFSFHGLPERQIRKSDPSGQHCLQKKDCCAQITDVNAHCYRAQCFATARALAQRLDIAPEKYTVCFQSRLGVTNWIRPYTDHVYQKLASEGVKRLTVLCPSFVADCLETLEEVQIRCQADFVRQGGESIKLVPSLNASTPWVKTVAGWIEARSVSPQ